MTILRWYSWRGIFAGLRHRSPAFAAPTPFKLTSFSAMVAETTAAYKPGFAEPVVIGPMVPI
jgi:hypothetical protein